MTDKGSALSGDWDFDPAHTRIGFSARHAMVTTVRGSFNDVTGRFYADLDDMSKSYAEVTLKAASVDTRNQQRDDHLRSADFFSVDEHPTMTYRSTGIRPDGDGYLMDGELTLKGVTRPIVLELEVNGFGFDPFAPDPATGARAGFTATGELDRSDFGIMYTGPIPGGGVTLSEKVRIVLEIEAVLQAG
jgi:polyisoprenoid-binding protein YceI